MQDRNMQDGRRDQAARDQAMREQAARDRAMRDPARPETDVRTGAKGEAGTNVRDPKNTGAVGDTRGVGDPRVGAGRVGTGHGEAPGAGGEFTRDSGTFRTMKSWQPWALAIAAVVLIVIGVMVL